MEDKKVGKIHKNHRERMKKIFLETGIESFSDVEKLEFLLFFAISRKDTNIIAHNLIEKFGHFNSVLEAPISALATVDGVGEHTAILIHLFLEMFNVYGKNKCLNRLKNFDNAKEYAKNLYNGVNIEQFYIVCLNSANKIIERKMVAKGTSSEAKIYIRDLAELAINNKSDKVVLIHNHPNGNYIPSNDDILFTARVVRVLTELNVFVSDHIIVGEDKCFSFLESGMIEIMINDAAKNIRSIGSDVASRFLQHKSRYEY